MRDFNRWLAWTRLNREEEIKELSYADLERIYNEYYSCDCQSCVRRKELGMMPVRASKESSCTMPMTQLDIKDYLEKITA